MKYEAIEENSSIFEVEKMCRALELKAPNYYRWKRQRDKGCEKRKQELEKEGYEISEYKVRRLMRENGFYPETQRKYKPIHNGKATGMYSKNRLKQNFMTKRRNEVWAGDITYIKSEIGWIYLAVVIDLYNREIIGYEISKKI